MDKTQVASNVTLKEMTNIRKAPPLEGGHHIKLVVWELLNVILALPSSMKSSSKLSCKKTLLLI